MYMFKRNNVNVKKHRASCVADEINFRKDQNIKTVGDSVLGMVRKAFIMKLFTLIYLKLSVFAE